MAMQLLSRTPKTLITAVFSRSFSSSSLSLLTPTRRPLGLLRLIGVAANNFNSSLVAASNTTRTFSTRTTSSSLNDPSPNWSNRPPKETILLDGCDFEHWLVVMDKPEGDPTRDEIIDHYIKTLTQIVGSEDEARMKIYSVSTRCYYAFGALVSEELSYKIKELPGVRWVLPDSFLDVKNKDYGGEPFIDGKAVPYDPKYHEEWIRNNAKANERNRRNDRPRSFDRSRNFERRRENMQQRDTMQQNMGRPGAPPPPPNNYMGGPQNMPGPGGPPSPNNYMGGPQNTMPGPGGHPPPNNYMGGPQNTMPGPGGPPPPNNYMGGPQNNMHGPGGPAPPQNNYTGGASNMAGPGAPMTPPSGNYVGGPGGLPPTQNNYGGGPQSNHGGMPPGNHGGMPPNMGWSGNMSGNPQSFQNGHNGGVSYQGPLNYQNNN